MDNFDLRKYLAEGKLLREDEGISPSKHGEGYFDTTVNGKTETLSPLSIYTIKRK